MQKTSLLLMLITIGTKFFGLAREKALAHFFGTSEVANIFLIAFTLPMVVSNLLSGSLSGGFIPIYTEIAHKEGREEADRFTSKLSVILALAALVLSLLAVIFAPNLVRMMASGFRGAVFDKTVYMTRITAVSITTLAVFAIFKAYLQIYSHFIVSILHSVVMNSVLIAAMFLGRDGNLTLLAFGILFAFVFQFIFFLPYIRKSGFHFRTSGYKEVSGLKKLFILIIPIFISTSVLELNNIISKSLASSIATIGVPVINYATKIQGFVTGIVVTSIITVTYPQMARLVEEKATRQLGKVFGKSLSLMAAFVLPATVGIVCFHEEIVRLLFLSGAFSASDVTITGEVLLFYGMGLFAIGIREIGIRIFYSKKEARVPVLNSVYMVLLNVLLNVLLGRAFGLRGLAMGTAIALWVGGIGMLVHLYKSMGTLGLEGAWKNILKILIASAAMGIVAKGAERALSRVLSLNISLILAIALGALTYFILAVVFRFEELDELKQLLNNKKKTKDA
ncbi:MAG: murein biosynthesis integral membrane protein MurJ [Peptoniphilus sp.]|nr:murein biosynthesis integral membrane protein MurJ [Peptoniphilus sp.]MDD7363010.1 murein biosynthesis integral membrane protein MurJ [Bacillota bacterium]MDY6045275.1 murein biosynthesis integral membrane protein MurJ [Peptoniphilus sp.]